MRRTTRMVGTLMVGTLVLFGSGLADAKQAPSKRSAADAVVAIVDTGINPYHSTFRDNSPRAKKHPSTYIPGYPKSAVALRVSLNELDYAAALRKDCERIWAKVKPGRLYWFPGTKIVGAVTFAPQGQANCRTPQPSVGGGRILDRNGHGTMTASRAASKEYGACKECLIAAVEFSANGLNKQDAMDSIKWSAANAGWIDAQSNSWGPLVPVWDPSGQGQLVGASPELVRAVEEVSSKHLAFWASGNGAAFRGGVLGHPTLLSPHLTPSAISVGGHDSGYVNVWPGFPPHVVSDSCSSWAAHHDHISKSEEDVGGGTSAATPYVAGEAARILLEARRILGDGSAGVDKGNVATGRKGAVAKGPLADGKLSLAEWKRLLFVTATPRPKAQFEDGPQCGLTSAPYNATPVKWSDVPAGYPEYLHIGYGAVDNEAIKKAFGVLHGKSDAPDRSQTDTFFTADDTARSALYEVWSKP